MHAPVVLVTGALTGIGRGTALSLARQGARPVVSGRREDAVAPGPVATEMLDRFVAGDAAAKAGFVASIPSRRAATPDEIAQTTVFLASDAARDPTWQSVTVDGGCTAQ